MSAVCAAGAAAPALAPGYAGAPVSVSQESTEPEESEVRLGVRVVVVRVADDEPDGQIALRARVTARPVSEMP